VWVDALSIDQNHDEEKGWQIQMMRIIYKKAQRVFVWLGHTNATSDMGMTLLQAGYRIRSSMPSLPNVRPKASSSASTTE
jgi:hypothetical protein